MSVRVRFAPSPTGQVHIGNIRAAIFNWLFARHEKGVFLLRIEDTDIERSTPQAIATLLEVMEWLQLNFDEEPLYQTSQQDKHLAAAEKLLSEGNAYRDSKGGGGEAILFRIPWDAEKVPGVVEQGEAELQIHPEVPLVISGKGLNFACVSAKGTQAPGGGCLAGFKNLRVLDEAGQVIFRIDEHIREIFEQDAVFTLPEARKLEFTRRAVTYADRVKGLMSKPLDSMKDLVIVRSDGTPVFHLANVVDDITQKVTHIIRGDDHVENTFRHLFLFRCLGAVPPVYAHLPMIVNAAGKPYSKRDGDAFVGDFRDKGFLPQTLFNYLSLLGWSPGDDREKMTRDELIKAFSLERCLHASAQMDIIKMTNLNGAYIAEMPLPDFCAVCRPYISALPWGSGIQDDYWQKVCAFMQSRVKRFVDVEQWEYFFVEIPTYDDKLCAKQFKDETVQKALRQLPDALHKLDTFTAAGIEQAIHSVTEAAGLAQGKLNQPIRAAVTGIGIGAGIYETLELLGLEKTLKRLEYVVGNFL